MAGFYLYVQLLQLYANTSLKTKRLRSSRDLFKIDALELFGVEVEA